MTTKKIKASIIYIAILFAILTIPISFVFITWIKNRPPVVKHDVKVILNSSKNTQASFEVKGHDLSLGAIFEKATDQIVGLPENKIITLLATGDVMLGRSVNYSTTRAGNFNWPFVYVTDLLRDSDITIINLEGTLLSKCPLTNEGMKFCGDIRYAGSLKSAGVDIASLANNHSADYGYEGASETKTILESSGLTIVGLDEAVYKNIKGKVLGLLSYNSVLPRTNYVSWADEQKIKSDLKAAKQKSDIIVVSFHWGNEYTSNPTTGQIELAHMAIDGGADIVLGHHPHWIQPIEIYKNKPIFYSLGNFVFDQMWSRKTKEGIVGKFTFYENTLVGVELVPIIIENYGQPKILTGPSAETLISEIKAVSMFHEFRLP